MIPIFHIPNCTCAGCLPTDPAPSPKRVLPMKIREVSYGRTIVIPKDRRGFRDEKVWFGFVATVEDGEDPDDVIRELQAQCDIVEAGEREKASDLP